MFVDLSPYLETHDYDRNKRELEEIGQFVSVERKMSIFAFFNSRADLAEQYADCLLWGLEDIHPWVRRSAVEFFSDKSRLKQYESQIYNSLLKYEATEEYPGVLDFYLVCPEKWKRKLCGKLDKNRELLPSDLKSLRQAILNE